MDANRQPLESCGGCGLAVEGGAAGCQAIMDELLALHFGNVAYFGVHRLFVDTYSVQHPDRYCASFKSLAAHFAHLCWSLEHGGSGAVPSEAIRRWVERHPDLTKPALPQVRYGVTVADVAKAAGPAEHHEAVRRWARAAWDANIDLHSSVRYWVRLALEGEAPAG